MKVDNGGREYMAAMKMHSSDLQMWAFLPSDITPFPLRLPSPEAVPSQWLSREMFEFAHLQLWPRDSPMAMSDFPPHCSTASDAFTQPSFLLPLHSELEQLYCDSSPSFPWDDHSPFSLTNVPPDNCFACLILAWSLLLRGLSLIQGPFS